MVRFTHCWIASPFAPPRGEKAPRAGRRRFWTAAAVVIGASAAGWTGAAAALEAGSASPWVSSGHAAARLVASGPGGGPGRLAAIEIRLDPGFITYWRNPGEAGLPPTIDTSASANIGAVAVDFPTPRRLDEGGTTAFGYVTGATLPLQVTLTDAGHAATLVADLDYAVCSTICLPAKAHLSLALPPAATPEATAFLAAAAARVPRPVPLGAPGPLAIDRVTPTTDAKGLAIAVAARAGAGAMLFVEPPDGWYLDVGPTNAGPPGQADFVIAVLQRPDGAGLAGLPLRLTLVDGTGAIETAVRMDETAAKP